MYTKFFRLWENPFKLAPSPAYYFLSGGHEEALAHIKYGISEGEGFILITGKMGVGKTLTCMMFIASLDEKNDAVYISNPKLSSEELIRKICSEFKVSSDECKAKGYLNAFYSFLIEKRLSGKRVVIFIDEAQNLKRDAIEQIRLLSNLETNQDKLLQIVLVGQPELTERLNSYALRQIGQRISVSYCINPLSPLETKEYIRHRLIIASQGSPIEFDQSVYRHIYKHSRGIPQLINIACKKVLFTSYFYDKKTIKGDIAKVALIESFGKADARKWNDFLVENPSKWIIAGCYICLLVVTLFFTKLIYSTADFKFQAPQKVTAFQNEPPKIFKLDYQYGKLNDIAKLAKGPRKTEIETGPKFNQSRKTTSKIHYTSQMTHSVQIGAFLIRKNAEGITSILRKRGYDARIVTFNDSKKRTWHTVRIGDYPSREIAKEYSDAFIYKEKRESTVVPVDNL